MRLSRCILVLAAVLTLAAAHSSIAAEPQKSPVSQKPSAPEVKETPLAPDTVVGKVNGVNLTVREMNRVKKVILAGQPGLTVPPERQKEFDKAALDQLISAELLYQAGKKLDIKDLDKQAESKITQEKTKFPNPDDFGKALKELDIDEKELIDFTRKEILINAFIEQNFSSKATISEEEAKSFYDKNPDKFSQPEKVRASHILIGVDAKATPEEKKKAQEKAEKLRKDIAGGADFATVAKDNSTCPSSKQGGDLGLFGKGQMVPPFEKAAFAMKPGEVSEVVETQFGYHIIKLTDKKAADKTPFAEVRPRIESFLKNQKIQTALNEFLTEAKKSAKIEYLLK